MSIGKGCRCQQKNVSSQGNYLFLFLPYPMPSHRGWCLKFSSSLKSDYREKVPLQNRCASQVYSESHLFIFMIIFLYTLYTCYMLGNQKGCEGETITLPETSRQSSSPGPGHPLISVTWQHSGGLSPLQQLKAMDL